MCRSISSRLIANLYSLNLPMAVVYDLFFQVPGFLVFPLHHQLTVVHVSTDRVGGVWTELLDGLFTQ